MEVAKTKARKKKAKQPELECLLPNKLPEKEDTILDKNSTVEENETLLRPEKSSPEPIELNVTVVEPVINESDEEETVALDSVITTVKNTIVEEEQDEFAQLTFFLNDTDELSCFTDKQLLSLYNNEELTKSVSFLEEFIDTELRSGSVLRHPLYELLTEYIKCREKQSININDIDSLVKTSQDTRERLWILETAKITRSGECQDGNPVEASHKYQIGQFKQDVLAKLTNELALIREKVHDQHALHSYCVQVTKLKIDDFIHKLVKHCNCHNGPVTLNTDETRSKNIDICSAISVLFYFQRRPCKDQVFLTETRQWLTHLISILIRESTWKDHMFLLHHVLRCPNGVSKWAKSYIQTPLPPFGCPNQNLYLNHTIALISTLAGPIPSRETFLPQVPKASEEDDIWVIVDSEGEDDESITPSQLKENDIIAIFNQIPLDNLFRQVFQIIRKDGEDVYTNPGSPQLLKIFAISRFIINTLEKGMAEYSGAKYQQFAKRMATVILHTVQYVTDAWEIHKHESTSDANFMERLEVEYNNIILKACNAFISTPQKSVLQFLISVPFSFVSLKTLWKLFHIVMLRESKICKSSKEWWIHIEEQLPGLTDADICYMLTSVANMALSRTFADWSFIKIVTIFLLQIGFINLSTRNFCYKTSRSLLSNLTTKYPSLLSVILNKLKICIPKVGNQSIYIFKDLPLCLWRPTKEDLELLEQWLLDCPFGSIEISLATYIIYNMNWGLNPDNNAIFLPRETHCRIAVLVVRVAIIHCPESPTSSHSTAIADTIKQLTSKERNSENLGIWVWSMLFKLRIHLLDQPNVKLDVNQIHVSMLPSLDSLPDELSPLLKALKENQVTAIFTVLVMTSTGHSIELMNQSGFKMLKLLMQCHRYLAVLLLLEHITPMYINCPESLADSDMFQKILAGLLVADKTFLKFAMSFVSSDFPGFILKQFGDMIQAQIENYQSPGPIIDLWLRVLTKCWIAEPASASYLMNLLIEAAMFQPETRKSSLSILQELLMHIIEASQAEPQITPSKPKFSLLNWVSGNSSFGALMKSSLDAPWFSLMAIEIEQNLLYVSTTLWKQLICDMSCTSGKTNIDSILKKCCSNLSLSSVPSCTIPIYRWAQQALETHVDHPALPIIWQKFFTLYLARMPTLSRKDLGSAGNKFFEGSSNQALLKKLKNKLNDCHSFFKLKYEDKCEVITEEKRAFYGSLTKLYTGYLLWLDDSSLHDPNVHLASLSPNYNGKKLALIFNSDENLWMEYLDADYVRNNLRQSVLSWDQAKNRHEPNFKPVSSLAEPEPKLRITKRLQKYDSPVPPPSVVSLHGLVLDLPNEALVMKSMMLDILKEPFKTLSSYAQVYTLRAGEHSSLDYCLIELVPNLYQEVDIQVTLHAACDTHNPGCETPNLNSLNCAGPAIIRLKVTELRPSESIDLAIVNNRTETGNLIKRALQQLPMQVSVSSIHVQQAVKCLEETFLGLKRAGDVVMLEKLKEVGVALFYHMTYLYSDNCSYPPMKQLITTCIETLGQCFISNDETEGPLLLSRLLEMPALTPLLATHFSPTKSSPQIYIQLYRTLMNAVTPSNYDLIFVLLTKFDISLWIESQKPRSSERCALIDLVGQALASAGQSPLQEFLIVHEVLRRQLCVLMMVEAPIHFCQVLSVALKHSESHSLATEVWYDILNALVWHTGVQFRPHLALAQVSSNMTKFAVEQSMLSLHDTIEMLGLFSRYFTEERHQYGLYGLYPKYRTYVSALVAIMGSISYAFIVNVLNKNGANHQKASEEVWTYLNALYSPWICPYYTQNLAQPTAAWIQQLTDDRSVLLPWISPDSGHAHKVTAIFTESLRFFLESSKGDLLNYVWVYYVNNFANPSVTEHILCVINNNILSLPWISFIPSLHDLELMLKVSDTYVPHCHTLLGAIFIEVQWLKWIDFMSNACPQHLPKILSSLLHLLIKLSNEPNVRQSGKILDLLRTGKTFRWELVDFSSYESVVNWFVMSYDPRVVLNLEEDQSQIDLSVMELLRYAAGFVHGVEGYHSTTPKKRQIYIRGCVKMILSCFSKYKTLVMSNQAKVQGAIEDMLILINTVVPQTGGNHTEAGLHVSELLTLVNMMSSPVSKLTIDTAVNWVSKRGDSVVSAAFLRTLGITLEDAIPLGNLLEATLEAVFNDRSGGDWDSIRSHFQEPVPKKPSVEEIFISEGKLLSFYTLLTKKLVTQFDFKEEMKDFANLTFWLSSIKHNIELEVKMIPLFHLTLIMGARLCNENPTACENYLRTLCLTAESWAEYKPSWGFLGAIGIKKQPTVSNRFKLLCRLYTALILSQIPERKGELPIDQPSFIRTSPHAPGGLTSNNMELGPSSEAMKSLSFLESMLNDKSYIELRSVVETSLGFIRKTENSLHNAHQLFLRVAKLLYVEARFIQAIMLGT